MIKFKLPSFFSKNVDQPTVLWHAAHDLFEHFDLAKIGANSNVHGHAFYFCHNIIGAMGAKPNAAYLYEVHLPPGVLSRFMDFHRPARAQGGHIQAAAKKLAKEEPISGCESFLDATGHQVVGAAQSKAKRLTAEAKAKNSSAQDIFSRDVLMRYGIQGATLRDGRSEADNMVLVYDPTLLGIRAIHFKKNMPAISGDD